MSKVKSAVALVLITILILGVCFMCTVSFSYGVDGMLTFNSIVSVLDKDANLGGMLHDGVNYLGGGFNAVYYPEGVISVREYDDDLGGLRDAYETAVEEEADADEIEDKKTALDDYIAKYERYPDANGSVYVEKETVLGEDGKVTAEFQKNFNGAMALIRARVERIRNEGAKVEVRDDYSVRIFAPAYAGAQALIMNYFGETGAFGLGYGTSSDASAATKLTLGEDETIRDYVKGVGSMSNGATAYVTVDFTSKGKSKIAEWTASAADTAVTLFFYIGDNAIISLNVNETINQSTLYISGSYTSTSAEAVAITLDTAVNGPKTELEFTLGEAYRNRAAFGDLAAVLMYVSFGVLFAGMMVFFFIRYRMLAFAHLYTSLIFVLSMILLVWGIPFLHVGLETYLALVLGLVLLSVSDAVTYESARKDYALGKTIASSVKAGYKRSFWQLFDLHIALAILGFVTFAIALTELRVFAFMLGLGAVLSGICSLAISRFHWAALMTFAKDKGKFCNFKREDVDDD